MRSIIAIVVVTLVCACGESYAQTNAGQAAATYTDAALSDPVWTSEDEVDAQIDAFLASPRGQALQAQGAWIGRAKAPVGKNQSSADWPKLRAAAYRTAWATLQTEFVLYQRNEATSEVTRRFFSDASNAAPTYQREQYTGSEAINEFLEKTGAVISAKLDKALRDLDVDPSAFSRGNNKQRKKVLTDAISRESSARSIGRLAGLWPVKTFTSINDGYQVIGVVGVYRPEFQELAGEIAGRRQILQQGPSERPLAERIPQDPAQLIDTYGIRVLRDEMGYPLLVSFGQWGVSGRDPNPVIMSKLREAAIRNARSAAETEMMQFINGTANYTNKVVAKAAATKYADVDREGYVEYGSDVSITDIVEDLNTVRAKANLDGAHDFKRWTYRDPSSGNILVGVVRIWSPSDAQRAKEIVAGRPAVKPQAATVAAPAERKSHPSYQGQSPDL